MDISFALAHLPGHETAYLGGGAHTILAWGCGSEEVAAAASRAFPQTQVSSFDSSQSAAAGPEFDVIVTSDCLERVEQPLALIEKQLQACKSLYIALTPYDEYPLPAGHRSQFRVESFPAAIGPFTRIHAERLADEAHERCLLVVYASESYLRKAVDRPDSMALAMARLVAAQLADCDRAASAAAERSRAVRAEAERDQERQRADLAEASLRAERLRWETTLRNERQSWEAERRNFAAIRDSTIKGLEDFQSQFETRLSTYRSERAWSVMVGIRKYYTLLVRNKLRGAFRQSAKLEEFEPVFPDLASFIPPELATAAPSQNLPEPAPADSPADILSGVHPTELIRRFFTLLLREAPDAREIWSTFHVLLQSSYEDFSRAMGRNLDEDDLLNLLALFLIQVARNGVLAPERTVKMFHIAERLGVHILPVHFYSPIPNTGAIEESAWNERFDRAGAWSLNENSQLTLLTELGRFASELGAIPEEADESVFHWNNPTYSQTDAAVYYSMIRRFQPALVIEVGSGYSTMIAAAACARNGAVLEAIDPYPAPGVTGALPGLTGLVKAPVERIPLASFQALGKNDILFIDSTHVSKIASDVNYLMLSVLPALNTGVLVHLHDIFLPWNYPRSWIMEHNIFWNEQYLLLAFLLFNDRFEIVLANHYLAREQAASLLEAFPFLKEPGASADWSKRTPSSIWLRRK